jgi:hypothetical protein
MRIKNKKATVFNLILVFGAIAILIYAYLVLGSLKTKEGSLGEKQKAILRQFYEAERDLSYIDKSAEYSFAAAVNKLNNQAGFSIMPDCGSYYSYNLWQTNTSMCYPTEKDMENRLISIADDYLRAYLSDYEFKDIPADNYDYFIYSEKNTANLVGIALKNLLYEKTKPVMKYSIKPSFNIRLNYGIFSHYKYIKDALNNEDGFIDQTIKCENAGKKLSDCIKNAVANLSASSEYEWSLDCDFSTNELENSIKRIYAICVKSRGESILEYAQKQFSMKNPIIKFAIYIKDLPPKPVEELGAISAPGEDNSVIVSWKKSDESDIMSYNIYYSNEFTLKDKAIIEGNISESEKIAGKFNIKINNIITADKSIKECQFEALGKPCQEIDAENLYLDKDGFLSMELKNLENKEYSIAVTAQDKSGNEINYVKNSVELVPEDNLAPAKITGLGYDFQNKKIVFDQITTNIDHSYLNASEITHAYYFLKQDNCDFILSIKEDGQILSDYRRDEEGIRLLLSYAQQNMRFCFVSFASDASGNPAKLIENEDNVNVLMLKREYIKIFPELYSSAVITIP